MDLQGPGLRGQQRGGGTAPGLLPGSAPPVHLPPPGRPVGATGRVGLGLSTGGKAQPPVLRPCHPLSDLPPAPCGHSDSLSGLLEARSRLCPALGHQPSLIRERAFRHRLLVWGAGRQPLEVTLQPGLTVLWAPAHFPSEISHKFRSSHARPRGQGSAWPRGTPSPSTTVPSGRTACAGLAPADPSAGNNGSQVTTSPHPPAGLCSLPSCCPPEEVSLPGTVWPALCFPRGSTLKLSKPASLVEPAW